MYKIEVRRQAIIVKIIPKSGDFCGFFLQKSLKSRRTSARLRVNFLHRTAHFRRPHGPLNQIQKLECFGDFHFCFDSHAPISCLSLMYIQHIRVVENSRLEINKIASNVHFNKTDTN
ncbi:hypothetical protein DLM77_18175 [Leptospira yasudae]|uniref:Uncharacterized protein n=1 Tax=Leptospira yasudae TaxID=2202201 RepID=A0ABX9LYL2_9LEPT|nr:hypothetical protein DLM77_18175 [Leptospira yasudae]